MRSCIMNFDANRHGRLIQCAEIKSRIDDSFCLLLCMSVFLQWECVGDTHPYHHVGKGCVGKNCCSVSFKVSCMLIIRDLTEFWSSACMFSCVSTNATSARFNMLHLCVCGNDGLTFVTFKPPHNSKITAAKSNAAHIQKYHKKTVLKRDFFNSHCSVSK